MRGNPSRIVWLAIVALTLATIPAFSSFAQSGVGVEVKEVTDNRAQAGQFTGNLEISLTPTGNDLERAVAARVVIKDARDDMGNDLLGKREPPDFRPRDYNSGILNVTLGSPARAAKAVTLSGTVELFVPARDPNSTVKLSKALSKLDAPLNAKALKAEKMNLRLLSHAKYQAEKEKNKIDDKKIAEAREMAKKEGVSDEEFNAMMELAKALQEMGAGPLPPGAVVLSGKESDFDKILKIRILKADGSEISVPSTSSSTFDNQTMMVMEPSEEPPADAMLEITILTKKSTLSFPFQVKDTPLP
ncbi:MAG: hypothetical protein ACYC7A_11160 [Thermoanaerobaculia bacterium]